MIPQNYPLSLLYLEIHQVYMVCPQGVFRIHRNIVNSNNIHMVFYSQKQGTDFNRV